MHALREKKKKRIAPRNSAGQAAKPPRRKELGTIPFRLPTAGRRIKVYFNPISYLFHAACLPQAGAAESISILFPLYFLLSTYNPRCQETRTN
jgi:hypothetical protein